ncbi:hypothetical protein AX14_003589 [Amanita brunnescens Koide BX004]|nr:hypothetical protein AX14_003589 [Amanita brunnescens Koide BX004]
MDSRTMVSVASMVERSEYEKMMASHDNFEARREPDAALYAVAHEADIFRGPQAALAARLLEVVEYMPNQSPRKWIDMTHVSYWISSGPAPPRAESPSSWSPTLRIPFSSPKAHEERFKARMAEDHDQFEERDGSDEEPDDVQKELMRRTAVHLHSSPNPAQLEMRILANHGADKRFAFLRRRWPRKDKERTGGSLNALARYGDSDEDGSHSEAEQPVETVKHDSLLAHTSKGKIVTDPNAKGDEASIREARRARAKDGIDG